MCTYVLGNSWAIQRNVVGTNLALMQFCENGIREAVRQCGNVLPNVGKWTSLKKKSLTFPDHHTEITEIAHVRHFFLANCQTSSSHFLWVPFTLGGRHQPRSLSSLSVWLSFVHFLPRLSTPDPVGGASAGSRQVEIRGGGRQSR